MTTKHNTFQVTLQARETASSKLGAVLKYLKGQPHYDFKEDIINYLIARYYPHAIKTLFPEEVETNLMAAWEGIGQLEGYIAAIKERYGISNGLTAFAPNLVDNRLADTPNKKGGQQLSSPGFEKDVTSDIKEKKPTRLRGRNRRRNK